MLEETKSREKAPGASYCTVAKFYVTIRIVKYVLIFLTDLYIFLSDFMIYLLANI